MWKIIFVESSRGGQRGVPKDLNAIAAQRTERFFFFKHMPEDAGF